MRSLMEGAMKGYKVGTLERGVPFDYFDMADAVYGILDAQGLIDHAP